MIAALSNLLRLNLRPDGIPCTTSHCTREERVRSGSVLYACWMQFICCKPSASFLAYCLVFVSIILRGLLRSPIVLKLFLSSVLSVFLSICWFIMKCLNVYIIMYLVLLKLLLVYNVLPCLMQSFLFKVIFF